MTLICLYMCVCVCVCVVMRYAHVAVIYPGEDAFEVTCGCVCTSMAASGNDFRTQTTTQQNNTAHPVSSLQNTKLLF